jgi:hypothetical protein
MFILLGEMGVVLCDVGESEWCGAVWGGGVCTNVVWSLRAKYAFNSSRCYLPNRVFDAFIMFLFPVQIRLAQLFRTTVMRSQRSSMARAT